MRRFTSSSTGSVLSSEERRVMDEKSKHRPSQKEEDMLARRQHIQCAPKTLKGSAK